MFLFISMMKTKYFVVFISNSHLLTFNCSPVFRKLFKTFFNFFAIRFGNHRCKSIYCQQKLSIIYQKNPENPIDIFLENVKSINQTERNQEPFVKTIFRFKCCHPFVPFGYLYSMKNRFDIEFNIPFGFTNAPKYLVN